MRALRKSKSMWSTPQNSTPALLRLPTPLVCLVLPSRTYPSCNHRRLCVLLSPSLSAPSLSLCLSFYLSLPLSHVLAALFLSLSVTPFPLPRRSIVRSPPHPHHFSRSPSLSLSLCPIYRTSGSLFLTYSLTCSRIYTYTGTLYNIHAVCPPFDLCVRPLVVCCLSPSGLGSASSESK